MDGIALAELDIEAWRRRCTAAFQDFARLELCLGAAVGAGDVAASTPARERNALHTLAAGGPARGHRPRGGAGGPARPEGARPPRGTTLGRGVARGDPPPVHRPCGR